MAWESSEQPSTARIPHIVIYASEIKYRELKQPNKKKQKEGRKKWREKKRRTTPRMMGEVEGLKEIWHTQHFPNTRIYMHNNMNKY